MFSYWLLEHFQHPLFHCRRPAFVIQTTLVSCIPFIASMWIFRLIVCILVQPLQLLDRIAVSRTFLLSIEMAVITPFKDVNPLCCHVPLTETPSSALSADPRNLKAAIDILFSATRLADSFNLSKMFWYLRGNRKYVWFASFWDEKLGADGRACG